MTSGSAQVVDVVSSRERQRLETRERVFEAAMREFRRVGVGPAQVEDIVRGAGVARGTFYLHFPTKEHVLLEHSARDQAVVAERLRASLARSPRAFLRQAGDLVLEFAAAEVPAVSREMFMAIARHATELEPGRMALVAVVSEFFAAAQARGQVRRDLAPAELVAAFFPGVFGVLLLKQDSDPTELRATLHAVVEVFVRGIVP
jgi:AcrR family transcriptional regulator